MAITSNNVRNVKFLRNGSVFTPSINPVKTAREVALSAMNGQLNSLADGTAILGRYQETSGNVKTLVGFAYISGDTKTLTVFDVEGASADVEELRQEINAKLGDGIGSGETETVTAQLTALSGNSSTDTSATTSVAGAKKYADDLISTLDFTDTAVDGSYVSQVSEADGKISVSRVALPNTDSVANENMVVTDVTQSKGAITATASNITSVKLAGYAEGTDADIAATDTLGEALGKLQAQINAMDKSADVVAGQVVTTVTEVDGKVTETKANVKDLQLGGYSKDLNATGNIASGDTINAALSKLENKAAAITIANADGSINVSTDATGTDINVNIKSGEHVIAKTGKAGIYTDLDLVKITTGLPTTIKERYQLLATDDSQIGVDIDIYKDSSIVSITYITDPSSPKYQNLEYVYIDASGNTQTEYVDISSLVLEAEFASGITVTNHVAHGVVDSDSEENESSVPFLTVGADGFKVSGIKDAIDTKINKLDADLSGNTSHVTVGVKEVDGKITSVTVAEDNIANASDLATLSGKSITNVSSANSSIAPTITSHTDGTKTVDIVTDASKIKMTGFTAADSGFTAITTASTVTQAVKAIETTFIANEQAVTNALNQVNGRVDGLSGKTFTEIGSVNNSIAFSTAATADGTVKVDAQTDASKISGLTAVASSDEGAAKLSGVTASDSVKTGIENLYKSLNSEIAARKAAISGRTISSANKAIAVSETPNADGFNTTLTLTLDTTTLGSGDETTGDYNALKITNDGLFLSTTWDCGTYTNEEG